MPPPGLVLGIDGGQTGTRALLADVAGPILGEGTGGPIRHMFQGAGEEARAGIQAAIRGAFGAAGLQPGHVESIACGISGVQPGSAQCATVEDFVREIVQPRRIAVVPDYVTCLLGASGGEPGVVVVAGGGAVAYGRDGDGREAVAGGWGYLLGDEGSAFDIGRRAIVAAARAEDGRGEPTALHALVLAHFGLTHLAEIKSRVYVKAPPRQAIAALAPHVAATAREGDAAARAIMDTAGAELAASALAVMRRLFRPEDPVSVYSVGGVFRAGEVIRRPFRETLACGRPRVSIRDATHPPAMGAVILARELV